MTEHETTTIAGALPRGRRLMAPLTVHIEHDREYVAYEPLFHMHAAAPTRRAAIVGLKRILSTYVDVLTMREATLGPAMQDQLAYLRDITQ